MSRIKDHYFEEINQINEIGDMVDAEYLYQIWMEKVERDESIEKFIIENEERAEAERIFSLTNTYPI